tara:strand:- start:347 stop:553 length:207 start_codon:yes stop_codon:yes gene_type:complete
MQGMWVSPITNTGEFLLIGGFVGFRLVSVSSEQGQAAYNGEQNDDCQPDCGKALDEVALALFFFWVRH